MKTKINAKAQRTQSGAKSTVKIIASAARTFALLCALCASAFLPARAQTPVMFPLNQMFSGASYTKSFTLQAAQSWITDGTNAWIGAATTVTPAGGTNPVVQLTPNTYLVTFSDATYPWRIAVPSASTVQNAIALSTGPLPTFLVQPVTPLAAGNGIVVTNQGGTNVILNTAPAQLTIPFNHTTRFRISTFQAGNGATNGVWFYSGFTPTNLTLESYAPTFTDSTTNNVNVRDVFHYKYTANNGISTYLLVYTTHYGDLIYSGTPGPGLATSPDGAHWTQRGYFQFGTNYYSQWSPKLFVDATNGLHMTVALGASVSGFGPTNPFVCDLNPTNFLLFSNLRPILYNDPVDGTEVSAGMVVYTNNLYYYFSSIGKEWTNSSLTSTGWTLTYPDKIMTTAGPSVVLYNGLWYWFATDGQFQYSTSTDLLHWSPAIVATNFFQEGSALVEDYCAPLPPSTGSGTLIYPHQVGTNIFWSTSP